MKRMTFDGDDGSEAQKGGPLPCMWCRQMTPRTMLSQYGARCLPCYEQYIASPSEARGFVTGRRDTPQQAEMRKCVRFA